MGTAITNLTLPTATSGVGTLTYSISNLPAGLSFAAGTRVLSGTPAAAGTYSMTYTVTDTNSATDTITFNIIVVAAAAVPTFGGATIANQAYLTNTAISSLTLPIATSGTGTLTYSISTLPAGLSFAAATRVLSGTPTAAGTTAMTYTVTDTNSATDTITFSIVVSDFSVSVATLSTTAATTREATATVASPSGGTLDNLNWVLFDPANSETCGSSLTFPPANTYTSGTAVEISSDDDDNDKKACFRARHTPTGGTATTVYGESDAISGVDTTAPGDLAVAFTNVLQEGSGPAIFSADVTSGTHPTESVFTGYGAGVTGSITQGTFTIGGETYTIRLLLRNSADQKLTLLIRDSGDNTVNIREVFAGHTLRFVDEAGTRTFSANDAVSDTDGWVLYQGADATLDTIFADGNTFVFSIESGGTHYLNSAGASNTNDLATVTSDDAAATYTYKVVQSSTTCDENVSYEATIPGGDDVPAAEGDYNMCVKAADAVGNNAYAEAQFTKDITAPAAIDANYAGVLLNDIYINIEDSDDETDLISNVRSDESSAVYEFAVIPFADTCSSATYSAGIPQADEVTGVDGAYEICVKATDPAGNSGYQLVSTFTKDTVFNTPTLTLALNGENRVSSTDYLNAGDTMTFTVTVDESVQESSTTVTLQLDNSVERDTTMTKSGLVFTGVYTIASPDTRATSSPEVYGGTITDLAGNTLNAFGTSGSTTGAYNLNSNTAIRIDTTPPAQITISRLAEASDTCIDLDNNNTCDYPSFSSNTDNITSENTPDFEVTDVEAHATVTVTATPGTGINDAIAKDHTVGATPGTSYDTDTLPNNDYDVSMVQTDRAENTSAQSNTIGPLIIDTIAPPTTAALDLNESSDSCADFDGDTSTCEGGSNSDRYTNERSLLFDISNIQGGADDLYLMLRRGGNTPHIRVTNQTSARGPVSSQTATLIYNTQTDNLGSVDHEFAVELFDKAGNSAVSANNLTIYLDYSTPAPTLARSSVQLTVTETEVTSGGPHNSWQGYSLSSPDIGEITQPTFVKNGTTYTIVSIQGYPVNTGSIDFRLQQDGNQVNEKEVLAGHTLKVEGGGITKTVSIDDAIEPHNAIQFTNLGASDIGTIFTVGNTFTFTIEDARETDTGASNTDGITYSTQYAFDIGSIEIEQTDRGNGAKVVMYDHGDLTYDSNSDPQVFPHGTAVTLIDEVGHSDEAVTTATETVVTTENNFIEGKHDFRVCQTDDAGNFACNTGAVSWITDTTAPTAPGTRPQQRG